VSLHDEEACRDAENHDHSPNEEEVWESLNARRHILIDKEIDQALTASERRELDELELKAERHMARIGPLPFQIFDKLKAAAIRDGLRVLANVEDEKIP
jgi:hypothetical protein